MKPEPRERGRNRILLMYLLGVVVPGLFLGFLAFRGIRGDEALHEKQVRQELNLAAQDFFRLLLADLGDTVLLARHSPLVLEKRGSIRIITDELLYLPDAFLPFNEDLSVSGLPDRGWDLEFIDQDLRGAQAFQEGCIRQSGDSPAGLKARLALARILRKQGQLAAAMEQYREIRDKFPGRLQDGLPVELAAAGGMARIDSLQGNASGLEQDLTDMAHRLLNPTARYNEPVFSIFHNQFVGLAQSLPHSDSLFRSVEAAAERTTHLCRFLATAGDYLNYPGNQQVYLPKNGYNDLLVTRIRPDGSVWAALADLNRLLPAQAGSIMAKTDSDNQYVWQILDDSGKPIAASGREPAPATYTFPFPAPLPGWTIALGIRPAPLISGLLRQGRGLYAGIFGLIAVWLALGLGFTVHLINQEIRLSRMKTRFISNVSHEFKSPVTSIRHMSELLKLKRVRTEEKKEEFYDSMVEQCDHLGHLIGNILDFSKIEDDIRKFHFEPVNLSHLVESLVILHRNRLSESGLEINFMASGSLPPVMADADAIRQVVYNLLDNAVKYGAGGSRIDVSVSAADDRVLIGVKDYGKGIPAAERGLIFERFHRVDEPSNQGIRGSGIGLTLVKKIAEAHGGRVEVRSETGNGAEFIVYLPVNQISKK